MKKNNTNNIKFSVGLNGNVNEIEYFKEYSNNIKSFYIGGLNEYVNSGRPQYADNFTQLLEFVKSARTLNIDVHVAMNSPCGIKSKAEKLWWRKIIEYVQKLEHYGVKGLIISHPFLIDIVKKYTSMRVLLSTICEVSTVRMAKYYEEMGVDIITPSMNINYDLDRLIDISRSLKYAKIQIMVNEHCLGDCPWRRFHHNHYAHYQSEIEYHKKCKGKFLDNPYLLLTNSTIRPEDIDNYRDITNYFKIVGRLIPVNITKDRLRSYIKRKFSGNYVYLMDHNLSKRLHIENSSLSQLFNKKSSCSNFCDECNYCYNIWKINGKKLEFNINGGIY